jgi:Cu/Ag efflux pump CusA
MQGNQSKLDKNENGKVDSQDFKMLRAKKEVGEMGKPSLKAKFEASMQKQYKSRPENMKEDIRSVLTELPSKEVRVPVKNKSSKSPSGLKEGVGEAIVGNLVSSAERLAGGAKKVMEKISGSKKPKLLKSMSKKSKY